MGVSRRGHGRVVPTRVVAQLLAGVTQAPSYIVSSTASRGAHDLTCALMRDAGSAITHSANIVRNRKPCRCSLNRESLRAGSRVSITDFGWLIYLFSKNRSLEQILLERQDGVEVFEDMSPVYFSANARNYDNAGLLSMTRFSARIQRPATLSSLSLCATLMITVLTARQTTLSPTSFRMAYSLTRETASIDPNL